MLGAGGMGEVYRARDTRLGREVALKLLSAEATADPERQQRFEQEARAASALNHPNIVAVYDVGVEAGAPYIVTELVEGESLRAQVGAAGVRKLLDLAIQIADGMAAAHQAGITHRDLKPENIMVTPEGRVKILDFGLAKASATAGGSEGETVSGLMTRPGVLLGTVMYMSPEQARGAKTDFRTDQFSFGVILYEIAVGKRPFDRASAPQTLAAILSEDPAPLAAANPRIPPPVRWVVERCLAKDPGQRYGATVDLFHQLRDLREHLSETVSEAAAPAVAPKRRARMAALAGVAALGCAGVGFGVARLGRTPPPAPPVVRFQVHPMEKAPFLSPPRVSPDGSQVAFVAETDGKLMLWVRPLHSVTASRLNGTEGVSEPFWAPDSRHLGFFAQGKLKRIDIAGGPPQTLCDANFGRGAAWNSAGVIVFAPDVAEALYQVPATGGQPVRITKLDQSRQESSHRWPGFLPDGRHFLYFIRSTDANYRGTYVGELGSPAGSRPGPRVLASDTPAVYTTGRAGSHGYLLYVRDRALLAQPFDDAKFRFIGEPFAVADQMPVSNSGVMSPLSASDNGVLAYGIAGQLTTELQWFDREGKRLGPAGKPGIHFRPRLSPDQTRLAVSILDQVIGTFDIWILERARGISTRFTFDPVLEWYPVWSPDGRRIVFTSNQGGTSDLYQKLTSGTGEAELLLQSSNWKQATDWTPDGRFLIYEDLDPKTRADLWLLPMTGERKPIPFLRTAFAEQQAQFSPDGKWIAYVSNESGKNEVYVQAFPREGAPAGKWPVSTNGGDQPRWRGDGKELYYMADDRKLMAVPAAAAAGSFQAGAPAALFQSRIGTVFAREATHWDVTGDGRQFVIITQSGEAQSAPFTVVLNWDAGRPQR